MKLKRIIPIFFVAVLAVTVGLPAARVIAADDIFFNGNNIMFYDPDADSCQVSAIAGTGDNVGNVYNFLLSKGFIAIEAAAIVGNLQQESGTGLNPQALNNSSGAYGIAQWLGGRKDRLLAKEYYQSGAEDKSKELQVQLDYLWEELQGSEKAAYDALKNAGTSNVESLAIVFGEAFERYGEGEEGKRAEYAKNVYEQYGKTTTGNPTDCSAGAGTFIFYEQDDPRWANHPYGTTGKIGPAGCGPTSMAMIVATFADKNVTPVDTAELGAANGSAFNGGVNGTIHLPLIKASSEKWGLKYENVTGQPIDVSIDALKAGKLVYMAGGGPAPFTSGGHIVVLRGLTDDGKIIVADPYRNAADVYTPAHIAAYKGTTYIIEKE